MSMSQTNCREIKEIRNPKVQLSEDDAAAFRRHREQRLVRMEKDHAILRAARPTEDISALKNATDAVFVEAIPDFESRRKQFVEEFTERFDKHRPNALALTINDLVFDYEETRFDIQLEGDADIWFRRFGGSAAESVPSMQNALLLRSDPMTLKPR